MTAGIGTRAFWGFLLTMLVPFASTAQQQATTRPPYENQRSYENSAAGLKHLVEDMLRASETNDVATLSALGSSMVIPDPEAWFTRVFGETIGTAYAERYVQAGQGVAEGLIQSFARLALLQVDSVNVTVFKDSCNEKADEDTYPLLVSRQSAESLSEVIFRRGSGGQVLRFFAYIDGAFRYAGILEPYFNPEATAGPSELEKRNIVSVADLQKSSETGHKQALVKSVPPVYPMGARLRRQEGKVAIRITISEEGVPENLKVVKGICMFADSAVNAVRQWRYKPLIVEGEAKAVDTTVTVSFYIQYNRSVRR
jgi:TonB family protein